jgi:hypothetical protein
MPWYVYLAYFFGGAFLANAVPHYVNGISGRPFPTPFAKPPGRGLSSPLVNVLWATFNVVVGYLLVCHVGEFHLRNVTDIAVTGVGALVLSMLCARAFGERLAVKQ